MAQVDISKIKLSQLRAFAAVAEHQSFSQAAAELDLTQSSVSHAIATLETLLGVELLFRRRRVCLTPAGETLIQEVKPILEHLQRLGDQAVQLRGLTGGQVRIAAIRSLGTYWLPEMLAVFQERFPQVQVTMTICFDHREVQLLLHERAADIGLLDLYNAEGLTVAPIGEDGYIGLLSSQLPPQPQLTWEQLSRYPLIMPTPTDRGYDDLRDYLRAAPRPLQAAYEINGDDTMVGLVAQGLGLAILPELAALPIPPTVQVCQLPVPLGRTLAAAVLTDALHPPAVFAFLDLVREHPVALPAVAPQAV